MTVPSNLVPTRISELPTAGTITGTELVPVVQNGVTKRATAADLAASPSQTQSFVVVNSEASLPNERTLAVGSGLSLVDGGAGSTVTVGVQGELARFRDITLTGIVAVTGSSSAAARTIASGSSGISVSDGNGVSGNPTISAAGALASLQNLAGTGSVMATSAGNYTLRTLTGTSNQITITNATGVSGDPTFAITNNPVLPGAESVVVPSGTTAQRPGAPSNGMIRYNTDLGVFEGYKNGSWETFAAGTGVTSVATGTGLTGGPITSTGTISLANTAVSAGSYGSATAAPTFTVDAQGRLTAAATVTITPAFASITATPTTLSGYGITDGVSTSRQVIAGTGLSGGGALTSNVTLSLASTIAAGGPTGSGSVVPVITYNAQGQLTAVTTAAITPASIGGVASVAGTANEITATGTTNVTLSLPAALTFTGKTVTGGTFSSPTITVATLAAGSVAAPSLTTTGDTNTGLYFPAADTIAATTGGTERMRITSGGLVGIGTSSPNSNALLTNNGNIAIAAPTRNQATSNQVGVWTSDDPADNGRAAITIGTVAGGASSNSYIAFTTNNYGVDRAERMRIDSSGNVGIATTSPSSFGKFAVQGASNTRAFYADALAQPVARYDDNSYVSNGLTIRNTGVAGSNQGIGLLFQLGAGGTAVDSGAIQMRSEADYSTAANQDAAMAFFTAANGTNSERMRIDSSGNVGIGTSLPNSKLHVNGSQTLTSNYMTYLVNAYYDTSWKYVENGIAWGIGNNFGGPSNGVCIAAAASNSSGAGAALTWLPRLNIDSSGNVGIGTSGPVDLLQVNRGSGSGITSGISLSTAAGSVGDGSYIKWTGAGTAEKIARIDGVQEGTDVGSIRFNTGNGADGFTERVRIESTGRLKVSYASNGVVTALTDGATITPDFNAANNYSLTIGGNRTLANPTNQTAGQSGAIVITQDATGSRTLAYGSNWKFAGGSAPTLTTTANAVDVLLYYVESASRITATLINDVK